MKRNLILRKISKLINDQKLTEDYFDVIYLNHHVLMFEDYFWHHHVLMSIQTVHFVSSEDFVSDESFSEVMLYRMQLNLVLQCYCRIHYRQIQILMYIVIVLDVSHRSRNDDSVIFLGFFFWIDLENEKKIK